MIDRDGKPESCLDVLDRVLDKGIAFDAWVRTSEAGIDLVSGAAHMLVASIDTYVTSFGAGGVLLIVAASHRRLSDALRPQSSATGIDVVSDRRRRERRWKPRPVATERREAARRIREVRCELDAYGIAVVVRP